MSDIVIKKTQVAGVVQCPTINYTIDNFCSFDITLCSRVDITPIPLKPASCAILVKAEGNMQTFRISWTIKDELVSVVSTCSCVKTVQQQIAFLLRNFEASCIGDSYTIVVDGLTEIVFPQKLTLQKTASGPVTYVATYELVHGNIVASETI